MSDRDVARLHPAIITTISLVTAGLLGVFTVGNGDPAPYRVVVALFAFVAFIAVGVWLRALYRVSRVASGRGGLESGHWFFFVPAFGFAINKLTAIGAGPLEQWIGAVSLFLGGFGYIFCVWKTAEELEHGDRSGRVATTSNVFGTSIALFYIFVGAWILRPRILQMTMNAHSN